MSQRKVILYISMSLDGFIASKNNDISWLSIVEKEGEDYGYKEFLNTVDTYIVGRNTYDIILKLTGGIFPQAEKLKCFIISRQKRENENGVIFYNGNIEYLIRELKNKDGKNIYCDGGAQIVKLLMDKNLIDEYIISVIPIILGDGIRLFKRETHQINIKFKGCKKFDSGLVQLYYEKNKRV